ncbi:MAG: ABC transporter permease [Eubacterium sp.]|jgi:ABC-2 type transport system permease protein
MTQLKYRFLQAIRLRDNIFWGFFFPLALAMLFYFAFGGIGTSENFEPVKTAVVVQEENTAFKQLLDEIDGDIIIASYMQESEAESALRDGEVSGIFYCKAEPSLTVPGNGFEATVLSSILEEYGEYENILDTMIQEHPERIEAFFTNIGDDTKEYIRTVSLGGNTYDVMLEYYFALVAMACFYGCFTGQTLGEQNAANVSQLAARRAISPRSKMASIFTDMFVGFAIQFLSVVILLLFMQYVLNIDILNHFGEMILIAALGSLLGVSFGIFVGSLPVKTAVKSILTIAIPLFLCFLSGLMYGGMKQTLEETAPIINRINPAALISDALYYLNVYEDMTGYTMRLIGLAAYSFGMAILAVLHLRRQRYVSI